MVKSYRNPQPFTSRKRPKRQVRPKATMKRFYNSGYKGLGVQKGSNGITDLVNPPRTLTPAYGGPFGQVFDTELCYADYFSMNPSQGGTISTTFLANGLYDPFVPSGGHQPAGFDYLADLYDNWQVLSSLIEITVYPTIQATQLNAGSGTVNANLIGGFLAIGVRDTVNSLTGILTTLTDILERPNIRTKFINTNDSPTSIRANFSMPKFYGRTRGLDDAEITGNGISDPADKVYYHVIFGPPDGSTDLGTHQFVARLKYKCRFFNPKALRQS